MFKRRIVVVIQSIEFFFVNTFSFKSNILLIKIFCIHIDKLF